jgi:hypothetical protein
MNAQRLFLLAAALAVSACSGQSASLTPATAPAAPAQTHAHRARVAFAIRWPRKPVTVKRKTSPQFVSPSTMSVVVTVVAGAAQSKAIANNTGSRISTISLDAPVGSDTFTVSLYDAHQPKSAPSPVGRLLGQVSLVQKIVAGKLNTVAATVNGLVRSVTVAPLAQQPFLEGSSASYTIVGQHTATFVVTPRDADGNAIVPPGITPTVSLQTDPSNSYFAVLPSASSATQFSVVVTAAAPPNALPGFTARATDAQNTTVTTTLTIAQRAEVYVSYGNGKVLAFDDAGNPILLAAKAFAGLTNPVSLAYDTVDETLFVADSTSGTIFAFDPDGNAKSGFTPAPLSGVLGVTWDSTSTMSTLDAVAASSAVIANARTGLPSGDTAVVSPFTVATGAGIAYAPEGPTYPDLLLVSDQSTGALDAYTPYGVPTLFGVQHVTVGPPAGTPGAIATDPTGLTAWVTGTVSASGTGEIWRLPLETNAPPESAIADANIPAGLAYDANLDRLFVAESSGANVAAYMTDLSAVDPSIVLAPPVSSGASKPQGVAIAY